MIATKKSESFPSPWNIQWKEKKKSKGDTYWTKLVYKRNILKETKYCCTDYFVLRTVTLGV